MRIEYGSQKSRIMFDELHEGDCFIFGDYHYVKSRKALSWPQVNAFNLSLNIPVQFEDSHVTVKPVTAVIQIHP